MKLLILCGCATIGFVFGAATGSRISSADPSITLACATVGALAGFVFGEMLLNLIGSRKRRPPRAPRARSVRSHEAKPFSSRLAAFTHRAEADVLKAEDDRSSSMPFWSAAQYGERTPPRPASVLRQILLKIRAILGHR